MSGKVGLVFQDDALWPAWKVSDNVGYALKLQGVPRPERRERVAEALNLLRIDRLARLYPDELSGLNRQRVALARTLAAEPRLLILDEPTARLEARVRDDLADDLRRLQAELGLTTIVLTHDVREAFALADRIAVMDLGKILQIGTPQEVYNRPVNAFVARFLGPVNLLQGQVEGFDARGELVVRTRFGRLIGQAPAAGGPLVPGSAVTLAIRPESLGLGPQVPADANRFPATVERLSFQGPVRRVELRGQGDWPIIALALQGSSQNLREGQSVTLSVLPEHMVVLLGKYVMNS